MSIPSIPGSAVVQPAGICFRKDRRRITTFRDEARAEMVRKMSAVAQTSINPSEYRGPPSTSLRADTKSTQAAKPSTQDSLNVCGQSTVSSYYTPSNQPTLKTVEVTPSSMPSLSKAIKSSCATPVPAIICRIPVNENYCRLPEPPSNSDWEIVDKPDGSIPQVKDTAEGLFNSLKYYLS